MVMARKGDTLIIQGVYFQLDEVVDLKDIRFRWVVRESGTWEMKLMRIVRRTERELQTTVLGYLED